MLHRLPAPLHGVLIALVFILNTLLWAGPVYIAILLKVLAPPGQPRRFMSRVTAWMAQTWALCNVWMARVLMRTQWDIQLHARLRPDGQYLVSCNHQTWNDIFVLTRTFGRDTPFFKFFLKRELIWVPILGLAWWGLDYPFMQRFSREKLEKHPELRGKDLETTRKACEKYRGQPVMILNFLEGTRFTPAKHAQQQSPYRHLLKPKAGGFAFALSAMRGQLDSLLDVTIVYPDGARGFWDFMCGRMRHVIVEVRELPIAPEFQSGDYESDPAFRERFQNWVAELWAHKDRRIDELLTPVSWPSQSR